MSAPVRTRFTKAVGHVLLDEIERVSVMRERWRLLGEQMDTSAAFAPAIFLMTQAIDTAKAAIADDDGVASVNALSSLQAFDADKY